MKIESAVKTSRQANVVRLRAGPAWPADIPWPSGDHTIVLTSPSQPGDCSASDVVLSGTSLEGGGISILVKRQSGQLVSTFDFDDWRRTMLFENYRPEHTIPITARFPFHYHRLPGIVRNALATVMLSSSEKCGFPAELRDCGPSLIHALLAGSEKNVRPPIAVLTHDIDTARGFEWLEVIAAAEEDVGARACWNVVPKHYPIDEAKLGRLAMAGHEIGLHGIWHTNREAFLAPPELAREFEMLADFRARFRIRTYRGPSWYRTQKMFDVLANYFDRDLTMLDIDLICPGGRGGVGLARAFRVRPSLVEIPCTLPFEAPIVVGPTPKSLTEFWQPKIDLLKRAGGMVVVNTHPDPNYLGNADMLAEYRRLLGYLVEKGWTFKLPRDIAVD